MDLTDSFTWEDLPTRDAHTGHLTAAGWIPLTMKYSRSAAIVILCLHTVQSAIRIVTNHETIIVAWYTFDWTVSPFYELVNISQVTNYKTELSSIYFYGILNLSDLGKWHTSLSFLLSFVLSSILPYLSTMICNNRTSAGWLTVSDGRKISIRLCWSIHGTELEFNCRIGKMIKNSVYPMYRLAFGEYSSITLQQ